MSKVSKIDRVTLRLPRGFQRRGANLAREVAIRLAEVLQSRTGEERRLTVPTVVANHAEADSALAARIANAIAHGHSRVPVRPGKGSGKASEPGSF